MCAFLPGGLFSGARGKDGQPGWCVPWEWSRKGRSSWEIVPCFWRVFSAQAMVLFKTLLHKSQALCWGNKLESGPQGTPVAWPTALSCSPENVAWCKQLRVTPFCWGFSAGSQLEGPLSWAFSFPSRSTGFSKAVQKKTCSRLLAGDEMMPMVRWNC